MKLRTKFQDEDFEFGEVVDVTIRNLPDNKLELKGEAAKGGIITFYYETLQDLYDNWEDYKELKQAYYITAWGDVSPYAKDIKKSFNVDRKVMIGNYFESKEEAEEAVEKLKALKRLQITSDACSYRLAGTNEGRGGIESFVYEIHIDFETMPDKSDMDKLFGCEE